MHRSGSTTRASDEYFVGMMAGTPPSVGGKGASTTTGGQVRRSSSVGGLLESVSLLPKYDPQSEVAKKEAARSRSAESAVHVIPVVLIVCALVLWFFSSPQLQVASKDDSIVARIENMTIDGYSNDANSLLPDDVPSAGKSDEQVNGRVLLNKESV